MKIKNCRLCNSNDLKDVVDLGHHPLADTFLPKNLSLNAEVSYPLQLGLCESCGHVSTLFRVSAEDRYQKQDYSYDSSNSKISIDHFGEFADAVISESALNSSDLIVDIGSNVGTLLNHFKIRGLNNVLGVEPSENISKIAEKSGIPTINDFFSNKIVDSLNKIGPIKLLLSSNVLNHADNINDFLSVAKQTLAPQGMFVFEVPYLYDLVRTTAFDTIYHEHVHYFGIKPLASVLKLHGFSIFKIEKLEYMCGSIRIYTKMSGKHSSDVLSYIEKEEEFKLYNKSTYDLFMQRVQKVKLTVSYQLLKIKLGGGKIIGIGAATKGNTFLNYCGLDSDVIEYITDSSILKIGKLTPGSHIRIISDEDIDDSVTHALILPWNIADMLQKKLAHLNLKFYVPQVEVLSIN